MNAVRIAAVVLLRLAISLTLIYIFDTYYIYPQSLLDYSYAILIGIGVMLLDPRGTTIIVHIKPTGQSEYNRMAAFVSNQNSTGSRWQCSILPDNTGECRTHAAVFCAETFALFGRVLAWEIRDNITNPGDTKFSVSVENGVIGL